MIWPVSGGGGLLVGGSVKASSDGMCDIASRSRKTSGESAFLKTGRRMAFRLRTKARRHAEEAEISLCRSWGDSVEERIRIKSSGGR